MNNFFVYRWQNGKWAFWMNARGITAADLRHFLWLKNRNKNGIQKRDIKVCSEKLKESEKSVDDRDRVAASVGVPMLFNDPDMREAFITLHGRDVPGAKFKLKDRVIYDAYVAGEKAEFRGRVEAVNNTGEGYEYLIETAPVLAWEDQLRKEE